MDLSDCKNLVVMVCSGLEGSTRVFSVISSCIVDASLGR